MAKSRRDVVIWVVCLLFVGLNVALLLRPRAVAPKNEPEPDKRLTGAAKMAEWEAHLQGVRKYDQELVVNLDLPADQIETATSVQLLTHFVKSPMCAWLILYDSPSKGIERALRVSKTLSTLFERPDVMDAFIEWNQHCIDEINEIQSDSVNGGTLSGRIMACDALLKYDTIFPKTKGHAKDLLGLMCKRYRAMVETNELFDENDKPFGAVFNNMRAIIGSLAKEVQPVGDWDAFDEKELVARAEALLK